MKVNPIKVKNQFWGLFGHKVMELVTKVEEKRFEGSFDGDIDYSQLLFNMNGMIREIERLQIENNNLKAEGCGPDCKCKKEPEQQIAEQVPSDDEDQITD